MFGMDEKRGERNKNRSENNFTCLDIGWKWERRKNWDEKVVGSIEKIFISNENLSLCLDQVKIKMNKNWVE